MFIGKTEIETVVLCGRLQRVRVGESLMLVAQKMKITLESQAEGCKKQAPRPSRFPTVRRGSYDGMM